MDRYIHGTIGQIEDGITQFSEDYRNRTILISNAFNIVLLEIAGDDRKIDRWIKSAKELIKKLDK